MLIIQLSDLHIKASTDMAKIFNRFDAFFKTFINGIREEEEINYCICGDLIDHDEISAYSKVLDFVEYIRNKTKDFKYYINFVPGNHDLYDGTLKNFDTFLKDTKGEDVYQFNNFNINVYEMDRISLYLLNSVSHKNHEFGKIDFDSLEALDIKNGKMPIFMVHHTLYSRYDNDKSAIRNAYGLIKYVENNDVKLLLHGHTHGFSQSELYNGCKVLGVGPFYKEIQDVNSQVNVIEIEGTTINKIFNLRYNADTKYVSSDVHYVRKMQNIFCNNGIYKGYKNIIDATSNGTCINNLVFTSNMKINNFYKEVEENFSEQISIAEKWQEIEVPDSLYYNHGMYLKDGENSAVERIIHKLKGNATSSRAILPLINVEDVINAGDGFLPSLDIIQVGFSKHTKDELYITVYLRALEVNHFLKINICEVYLLVKRIEEDFKSITNVNVNIIAFRAQYKEKFGCFRKAELDNITPQKTMMYLMNKNYSKIVQMLEEKLELSETVIISKGIEELCTSFIEYNNERELAELNDAIAISDSLMKTIDKLKVEVTKTSVFNEIDEIEKTYTGQMESLIESLKGMV